MDWLTEAIMPISICVVLPIMIVWLNLRASNNKVNKTSEIVMKALENSATLESINVDKLVDALRNPKKSAREILYKRLLRGCVFTFSGIAAGILALLYQSKSPWDADDTFAFTFMCSCIAGLMSAIGLAYLLVYFISRKRVDQDKD